jgi:hypothetical protein
MESYDLTMISIDWRAGIETGWLITGTLTLFGFHPIHQVRAELPKCVSIHAAS